MIFDFDIYLEKSSALDQKAKKVPKHRIPLGLQRHFGGLYIHLFLGGASGALFRSCAAFAALWHVKSPSVSVVFEVDMRGPEIFRPRRKETI